MENNRFEALVKDAEAKYDKVRNLSEIYDEVVNQMKWQSMIYHEADEDHEECWYTEPEEDDYTYRKFLAYKEVLNAIEKLAK